MKVREGSRTFKRFQTEQMSHLGRVLSMNAAEMLYVMICVSTEVLTQTKGLSRLYDRG